MFRPSALVGIYNHGGMIARVVGPLHAQSLPCLVVDDGSDAFTRQKLDELERDHPGVRVEHLTMNRGRGAALIHGFELLARDGFTHAVVLDADMQHDPRHVDAFLDAARRRPDALILGQPIFDASAPKARLYGRQISRYLVHLQTLSFAIADPLCGYRCYPLQPVIALLGQHVPGARMDFDPEIAVRLAWAGVEIVNVPTPVPYPKDGISHFRMVRDNVRIAWMHTRLVCGMLMRLPSLVFARAGESQRSRA